MILVCFLPISIQTIEYRDSKKAKSYFHSKSCLPSREEGPFLGAVLPYSILFKPWLNTQVQSVSFQVKVEILIFGKLQKKEKSSTLG